MILSPDTVVGSQRDRHSVLVHRRAPAPLIQRGRATARSAEVAQAGQAAITSPLRFSVVGVPKLGCACPAALFLNNRASGSSWIRTCRAAASFRAIRFLFSGGFCFGQTLRLAQAWISVPSTVKCSSLGGSCSPLAAAPPPAALRHLSRHQPLPILRDTVTSHADHPVRSHGPSGTTGVIQLLHQLVSLRIGYSACNSTAATIAPARSTVVLARVQRLE